MEAGVKLDKKRSRTDSGASGDKRQRLSGYDSGFFESEESEPSPEISAGEIKETDSDRRGREKKEREQKKLEEAAERKRQGLLKFSESKTKLCIAEMDCPYDICGGAQAFDSDTSDSFVSTISEALPENYAGETKHKFSWVERKKDMQQLIEQLNNPNNESYSNTVPNNEPNDAVLTKTQWWLDECQQREKIISVQQREKIISDMAVLASALLQKLEVLIEMKAVEICNEAVTTVSLPWLIDANTLLDDIWTPDGQRWCTKCLVTQPENQYLFHTEKKFSAHCLTCRSVPCGHCSKGYTIAPFKCCPRCRRIRNESRKRKRDQIPDIPDGHQHCTACWKVWPENHFQGLHVGRGRTTKNCQNCRSINQRQRENPNTAVNQCRQLYLDWKKAHMCKHCGTEKHIEADHLRDKVKNCSSYPYWASNGGTEALKAELAKCQALCRFCHRLKSAKERGTNASGQVRRKYKIVNAEKLRVGACQRGCGRKVTAENLPAFDWAHMDRSTKTTNISTLCMKSKKAYFKKQWPIERLKCELLCCMCHKTETDEENKIISISVATTT